MSCECHKEEGEILVKIVQGAMWADIITHLGPEDIAALGLYREQPLDRWLEILCKAAAQLRDTEPCDRDHCPDNCTSTCSLKPTGAHDAKA